MPKGWNKYDPVIKNNSHGKVMLTAGIIVMICVITEGKYWLLWDWDEVVIIVKKISNPHRNLLGYYLILLPRLSELLSSGNHFRTVSTRSCSFTALTVLSTVSYWNRWAKKGFKRVHARDVFHYYAKCHCYWPTAEPAPRPLFLLQLFTASLSWAFQQNAVPPKYQYRDPVTSELLLCDQCPPGAAVKRHCTTDKPTECQPCPERHFAEYWHWGDTCQYCTSVCVTHMNTKMSPSKQHFLLLSA